MKTTKTGLVLCLILFFLAPLPVRAIPLSLEQNIQTILENQRGSEEEWVFVVLGDNRGNDKVYKRLLNQAQGHGPRFILHTGDLVDDGLAWQFEAYRELMADFPIPILHVPGNHDVRWGPSNYQSYVGKLNWFFDIGPYRLVGLDNGSGKFSDAAVELAQNVLNKQKTCLVAFHRPLPLEPWSVHSMRMDHQGGRGDEIRKLIKEADSPLVLLGHIHLYDEMDIDGIKYVISGGGGAPLYDRYGFGKPAFGFVLVEMRSGRISHRWVPLDPDPVPR